MNGIKQLREANFDAATSEGVSLIDFHADWCPPCKALAPTVDEFAKRHGDSVTVAKVDIDEEQELARRFNVRSIPTIISLKDGVEVDRAIGNVPLEELEHLVGHTH